MDRQGALDNLTSIETTANLLVNALTKKDQSFDGVHREELLSQTSTFLGQAQKLVLQLSNSYNLSAETLFHPVISNENDGNPPKASGSISLDDIVQRRWNVKDLLPNYPLLRDSTPIHLVSLVRSLRSIDHPDDLLFKAYAKIFTDDEHVCCNYDGLHGQLVYPRSKRLLFDQLIKLLFHERHLPFSEHEQRQRYSLCEKHFRREVSSSTVPNWSIDSISAPDENQWVCLLFRRVLSSEDIKCVLQAKHELKSPWDTNEMSFYHLPLTHLRWIKQKWLSQYPGKVEDEAQRWSQCLDWAMEEFSQSAKIRSSKRKTMEPSVDHKRSKTTLTFEEQYQKIDRTRFDVLEYASELLHLIFTANQKSLPTLDQLELLSRLVGRYYWTDNAQQTWSKILELIRTIFNPPSNDEPFPSFYSKRLRESHEHRANDIDRLFQLS